MGFYIFIGVIAIIAVLVIISFKVHSSYEIKVDEIKNTFLLEVSEFCPLVDLIFEVRTDGKKIKTWDKQHKIDYIINKNKNDVIKSLLLYNDFCLWWSKNIDLVVNRVMQKSNNIVLRMYFLGNSFRKRTAKEIKWLVEKYSPNEMKFRLRTYTYHSNMRHYNPNSGEWWYDDSPEESTFIIDLSPNDILKRVEVLAQYNFEMTEYQYKVDNQRRLMTRELRQQIIERDNRTCQICGKKCSLDEIEIDHIQPVSKGGKTTISNLQVLCSTCNRQKSNKWLGDISISQQVVKPQEEKVVDNRWEKFNKRYNSKKYNSSTQSSDCAMIGDKVKIRYIDDGDELSLKLVEDGVNMDNDDISILSPIGQAIYRQSKGDIMDVSTPSGTHRIQIIEIYKNRNE